VAQSYHRANFHPWERFPTFRENLSRPLRFDVWTMTGIHDTALLSACLVKDWKLPPAAIIIRCLRPISLPGGRSRAFPLSRSSLVIHFYASFRCRPCLACRPLFSRSRRGLLTVASSSPARAIFWAKTGAGRLSLRNSRLYSGPTGLPRRDCSVCARRVWLSLAPMGMRENLHRFSPVCLLFPSLLSLYLRRYSLLLSVPSLV
jgi:hypothetical protein